MTQQYVAHVFIFIMPIGALNHKMFLSTYYTPYTKCLGRFDRESIARVQNWATNSPAFAVWISSVQDKVWYQTNRLQKVIFLFLDLLRPLLSDACSTVRQCAVVAAARLGEHDEGVARQLLNSGMISITLENLNKYNVSFTITRADRE